VYDPKARKMVAVKVIYHFPIEHFIRALYRRKDIISSLLLDSGDPPEGHVTRSRGFKEKVLDNPVMSQDHRNIALVGTMDGVCFFDDRRRGAWPVFFRYDSLGYMFFIFTLRIANLPDALSTHMANVHLGMVGGNEFYERDALASKLNRKIRSPKSFRPHLTVLCDNLLDAYINGVPTTDFSYPEGAPGRKFRCHVMLLFWTGDYPAQALVSGTHSKTCHWCTLKSTHAPEVSRRCWGDYRCYLPDNHPLPHACWLRAYRNTAATSPSE
jgi:hypothetical protein